jgi:glucokinase
MLLCADVGGTNTRLHLFKVPERTRAERAVVEMTDERYSADECVYICYKYVCVRVAYNENIRRI